MIPIWEVGWACFEQTFCLTDIFYTAPLAILALKPTYLKKKDVVVIVVINYGLSTISFFEGLTRQISNVIAFLLNTT